MCGVENEKAMYKERKVFGGGGCRIHIGLICTCYSKGVIGLSSLIINCFLGRLVFVFVLLGEGGGGGGGQSSLARRKGKGESEAVVLGYAVHRMRKIARFCILEILGMFLTGGRRLIKTAICWLWW